MPARRRTMLLGLVLSLVPACSSYRAVSMPNATATRNPAVAPGDQPVRLRFAVPRDVPAVSRRGDTLVLRAVSGVGGEVLAVRGDTLLLRLSTAREGAVPDAAWSTLRDRSRTARVVPTSADHLEAVRPSTTRTVALVALASLAVVLVILGGMLGGIAG